MAVGTLILVETSAEGNLGAAMRVAANFAVPRLHLVRPRVQPDDNEVLRWACGADAYLEIKCFESVEAASAECTTVAGTASGRGREGQPLVTLVEAAPIIYPRGLNDAGLLFGNETSGLRRSEIDLCDLVINVPTSEEFPVLNLTQTIAIVVSHLSIGEQPPTPNQEPPARQESVEELMKHLRQALGGIGFLDPHNPDRMLRRVRRLLGRAGPSEDEITFLRGICRQILWAAKNGPLKDPEVAKPQPKLEREL